MGFNPSNGKIAGATDVALGSHATLADGQVLTYSGTDGLWENKVVSGGGGVRSATIVIAAANSKASSQAGADYVCTGTSSSGGDEVTINTAIGTLPGANSYGIAGRVVLMEGDYYLSGAIVCDKDDTTIEGQGHGQSSNIHYVPGAQRQAAIIMGNTRNTQNDSLKNLSIYSSDIGGNIQTGSGSGIIFRSSVGHIENIQIRSPERDALRIESIQTAASGATAALNGAIATTPNIFSSETWTVASSANLSASSLATISSGGVINDSSVEIVLITSIVDSSHITVLRGSYGSPIQTHSSGDTIQTFTNTNLFEVDVRNVKVLFPGIDGLVIDPSALNCEITRFHISGGTSTSLHGGRHGIYQKGGNNKLLLCHTYFMAGNGLNLDGYYQGNDGTIVIGGEYENCTMNGIYGSHFNNNGVLIDGAYMYGNGGTDVEFSGASGWSVQNCWMSSNAKHVYANGTKWDIGGNHMKTGNFYAIEVAGGATSEGNIHNNFITSIGATTNAVMIDGTCSDIEVGFNVFDRPVVESGGAADYNRIHDNTFLTTNGSGGNAITRQGSHTQVWSNKNIADVFDISSTYTAFPRDVLRASAASSAFTITAPASPTNASSNFEFTIIRTDTVSGNALTLSANSGQTINGAATIAVASAPAATTPTVRKFYLDGTNWIG
jgi:hypothetical protein